MLTRTFGEPDAVRSMIALTRRHGRPWLRLLGAPTLSARLCPDDSAARGADRLVLALASHAMGRACHRWVRAEAMAGLGLRCVGAATAAVVSFGQAFATTQLQATTPEGARLLREASVPCADPATDVGACVSALVLGHLDVCSWEDVETPTYVSSAPRVLVPVRVGWGTCASDLRELLVALAQALTQGEGGPVERDLTAELAAAFALSDAGFAAEVHVGVVNANHPWAYALRRDPALAHRCADAAQELSERMGGLVSAGATGRKADAGEPGQDSFCPGSVEEEGEGQHMDSLARPYSLTATLSRALATSKALRTNAYLRR